MEVSWRQDGACPADVKSSIKRCQVEQAEDGRSAKRRRICNIRDIASNVENLKRSISRTASNTNRRDEAIEKNKGAIEQANTVSSLSRLSSRIPPTNSHTSVVAKVRAQLSFWFSPSNLHKDRFLRSCLEADPSRWIQFSVLQTFRKIVALNGKKEHLRAAANGLRGLEVGCLSPSTHSESCECSVRPRNGAAGLKALLLAGCRTEDQRTVYVEPLPPSTTREALSELFAFFGPVQYISLPRFQSGVLKGFAFVEFESVDTAERCAAASPLNSVTGIPTMTVIPRKKWAEAKARYNATAKRMRRSCPDGSLEAFHPALRLAELPPLSQEKQPKHLNNDNSAPRFEPGVVVRVSGLPETYKGLRLTRKIIAKALEEYGPLAYVDFATSNPSLGHARFMHAVNALEAASSTTLFGKYIDMCLLGGKDEQMYWEKLQASAQSRAEKARKKTLRKKGMPYVRNFELRQNKPRESAKSAALNIAKQYAVEGVCSLLCDEEDETTSDRGENAGNAEEVVTTDKSISASC